MFWRWDLKLHFPMFKFPSCIPCFGDGICTVQWDTACICWPFSSLVEVGWACKTRTWLLSVHLWVLHSLFLTTVKACLGHTVDNVLWQVLMLSILSMYLRTWLLGVLIWNMFFYQGCSNWILAWFCWLELLELESSLRLPRFLTSQMQKNDKITNSIVKLHVEVVMKWF